MKLSRLYTNRNEVFPPIVFNEGLNVVMAEIRDPENLRRDTHNLGKTTLASLLDFCLLKERRKTFFLFKHQARFENFVFYLEVKLGDGTYITLRRAVAEATRISFSYSAAPQNDVAKLAEAEWDHWRVPFEKAKELLEGKLSFAVATDWTFRKSLGYALRLQDDYRDVFQLRKFQGAHADWKPFLAQLVGLDGRLVQEAYSIASESESVANTIAEIVPQLVGLADSPDRLEGMILLRSGEVEELEKRVDSFDFEVPDEDVSKQLVRDIERTISAANERRYHLQMALSTIEETLDQTVKFDLGSVERVFADAEVYFGDQLRRDYNELLAFLKSISEERAELLGAERTEIREELAELEQTLSETNARRVKALAVLREAESLAKFRKHTERLVELKATLALLERQRDQMDRLTELRRRLDELRQQRIEAVQAVRENIAASTRTEGIYRQVRVDFGQMVRSVLNRSAVLSSSLNQEGNIEFQAEILDESGTATSADDGHTYRKLLCVAFDVAVFSAYLREEFFHFVFHDGVLESLDDRKKRCLLTVLRERCDSGLQQVITVIDSDLPVDEDGNRIGFRDNEIVRLLHDEGSEGRLFRMESW